MICNRCGAVNPDNANCCKACGALLRAPERNAWENTHTYENYDEPVYDRSAAKSPDEYFFTPSSYGEERPYSGGNARAYDSARVIERPRKKSNAPYIVTSLLSALMAAFLFALPFAKWLSYQYAAFGKNLFQGEFTLVDLVRRFMEKDSLITFMSGMGTDLGLSDMLPDAVSDKYLLGRIGAFVVAGIFALGLLLFFIFILLAVFRVRAAAGMGISAALVTILANAGFLFMVSRFQAILEQYDVFSMNLLTITVKPTPYLSIALCILIIVMCIVFSMLDRRRKY